MAADASAIDIARSSSDIILTIWNGEVLLSHVHTHIWTQGVLVVHLYFIPWQLVVMWMVTSQLLNKEVSQCWKMLIAEFVLCFYGESHQNLLGALEISHDRIPQAIDKNVKGVFIVMQEKHKIHWWGSLEVRLPSVNLSRVVLGAQQNISPGLIDLRGYIFSHRLTLIPAWVSNHMPNRVWVEIYYPFPNWSLEIDK